MSKSFNIQHLLRKAPNKLLQQYFIQHGVLTIDFEKLTETKIEPIYEAWLELPEVVRAPMEQDFCAIHNMATEAGSKAIIDEANWHGESLTLQFSSLKGFHEHAFWTFLERPTYWDGASAFNHADTLPNSYWRKRRNMPQKNACVDIKTINLLEQKIAKHFHTTQGRGKNCKIDCYKRNDLDYFFAYPEDYAQANIEWAENQLHRRPYNPAFEVIFIYSKADGTLDIHATGDKNLILELQRIFTNTILNESLPDDPKDERVYDFSPLKSREFEFIYAPDSGISQVVIKKLRLALFGHKERITLEVDPTYNSSAIYDLLEQVEKIIPHSQYLITQVGIKVIFQNDPTSNKKKTFNFTISYPNSCSLKHDEKSLIIKKMLIDSGIELKYSEPNIVHPHELEAVI